MSDYYNIIDSAEKRAREEGERNKAIEIARRMIEMGLSRETVAKAVGLASAELDEFYA